MGTNHYADSPSISVDAVDLISLRIVRAIHTTGSITGAAAAIGYSQPAVSQHLRKLENSIGMPIVVRKGRGVQLTQAGEILVRHAGLVDATLGAARGELTDLAGLRTGAVNIAAFPSASATIIPALLGEMGQRYPGIEVTYTEAEPPEAIEMLRGGQVDVAITFRYPHDRHGARGDHAEGMRVVDLGEDDVYLVKPRSDGAHGGEIELGELRQARWIAGCPRCRGHLLDLCGAAGFSPRILRETDNAVAVVGMVQRGLGVALLPALALGYLSLPRDIELRQLSPSAHRSLQVVCLSAAERVPAVRRVIDVLTEIDVAGFFPEWGRPVVAS